MPRHRPEEDVLRRYVLGTAGEHERQQLDERLFASDETFDEIQALETEVVDEYVLRELSAAERESFERRLATSATLRHKVRLAEELQRTGTTGRRDAAQVHARPSSTLRWLAIAAGVAGVLWGGLTLLPRDRPGSAIMDPASVQQQVQQSPATTARREPGETADSPPPPASDRASVSEGGPRVIATVALSSIAVRSSAPAFQLTLPAERGVVEFHLFVEPGDEYRAYRAQLTDAIGDALWRADSLPLRRTNGNPHVVARIPSDRLRPGRYEFALTGRAGERLNDLGTYAFHVTR